MDDLGSTAEEVDEKISGFGDSAEETGRKASESSQRVNSFSDNLKELATVAAIVGGIKVAGATFLEFDDVARTVEATTGANTETMELMRFQARQLGKDLKFTAGEAASAQYEFSKNGFENNQILAATPGILNTAIAGQLKLAEATEITAGTLRMFRLRANDAGRVGDALAYTANNTSTDVRGLAESLKYAGKDAYDFKLSLEDTLAILGSLGNDMLKDSMAGTGLQSAFAALKDKNKIKYLYEMGIDVSEDDGSYKNFLDIIADMKAKLGTKEQITQKIDINTVFGEQGSRVVGRLLDLNTEKFEKLRGEIHNSEGTAARMAEVMERGLGGALRSTSSSTADLFIGLISLAEPGLTGIVRGLNFVLGTAGEFLNWLNSGSYAANTLYFAIVGLTIGYAVYSASVAIAAGKTKLATAYKLAETVATGALTMAKNLLNISIWKTTLSQWGFQAAMVAGTVASWAYGQAILLASGQISIMTFVTNILSGAMGLLSGLFAFVTSPVLAVVAAVAGLAAGFYFLYQKSERFRTAIDPLIKKLQSLWEWVKKFKLVKGIIDGVASIGKKTKDILTAGGTTDAEKQAKIDEYIKNSNSTAGIEVIPPEKAFEQNFDITSIIGNGDKKRGKTTKGHDGYYLAGTKNSSNNTRNEVSQKYINNKNSQSEKNKEKTRSQDALILAINDLKKAIEKIKTNGGNKIDIIIPPELEENKLVSKLVEELKVVLMSLA